MRTTHPLRRWSVAVLLAVAMLLPTAAARAHGTHPHPRPIATPVPVSVALDPFRALLADAAVVAEDEGWSLRTALMQLTASERFNTLVGELHDAFPDRFAGGEFTAGPGTPSVVRFVGIPPLGAYRMVADARLDVDVRGGARRTLDEAEDRADEVHDLLVGQGHPEVITATTPGGGVEATVRGRLLTLLPPHLREDVTVHRSDDPVVETYATRGGAKLFLGSKFACTTGFNVVSAEGSKRGVATAGHCTAGTYERPSDKARYAVTFQEQHIGTYGDMEWSTTSASHPNEFFAGGAQPRKVTAVAKKPAAGTRVCLYGRAPGHSASKPARSCDRIKSASVRFAASGRTSGNIVMMHGHSRLPGDSGGPVYRGSTAYGLVTGVGKVGGRMRDLWTRADLLPLGLGVRVATKP